MPPESVAQKLYRRQQELRKKSGLPDPEEYKKRMQQYDKEPGMKKESVYVDELPDTGGDSRNIKSVVSDVDPQKKKRMDDALAVANKTSEQPGIAQKIREAVWGRDKMNNLQAAHDRHAEKAIAANRAGDHEAVKVHQSKMGMIKTQMNKLRKEEVEQTNEGAQQLLRKYMPGYAKRQIDKKMDDQKFGRDDVAKDANFYRYKKVQDKLKKEEVEQVDELRTSTLLRYATKANKSLIGGDRNKEEKRIKSIQKANYKIQTRHRVKEDAELAEAEFEVGHSHHKTTRMTYSRLEAKNAKDAIAKSQKPGHDLVHVYNMDKETFHHPETGRKKSNQYEQVEEAWSMNGRNPQRGVKVGDKVRSYDFPGMHDDHYIEGHVVADNPHTYHIRVNKVVRSGKEIPVPAHMQHVEAPKGKGMFSNAYAVHKMMAKQQSVTAAPEPATGAQKTFGGMRNRLREAAGYWGKKNASDIEKIKKALEKERKQAASNPGALTKKKPPSRVKKDVQFYDYMAKTKT